MQPISFQDCEHSHTTHSYLISKTDLSPGLKHLQHLPSDISSIPRPETQDLVQVTKGLQRLSAEHDDPPGRQTVLLGASLFPPDPHWASLALQWASEGNNSTITRYITSALASGVFPSGPWLADTKSQGVRDVLIAWGIFNLEVSPQIDMD